MAVNLKIYEYLELKKQGHELNMGELIAILLIHFILQHQENNLYNVCFTKILNLVLEVVVIQITY